MNSGYGKFMKRQTTDEQYSYILAHALVTFWIETVPRDILKKLIASLQNKDDLSTVSERIDCVYPAASGNSKKILKRPTNNANVKTK